MLCSLRPAGVSMTAPEGATASLYMLVPAAKAGTSNPAVAVSLLGFTGVRRPAHRDQALEPALECPCGFTFRQQADLQGLWFLMQCAQDEAGALGRRDSGVPLKRNLQLPASQVNYQSCPSQECPAAGTDVTECFTSTTNLWGCVWPHQRRCHHQG